MKRSIAVEIAGQTYTVKSDADERYVKSLAGLVDQKIRQVGRGAKLASQQSVAVLAALQIADDYMREKEARAELRRKVREKSKTIRQYLDREVKS